MATLSHSQAVKSLNKSPGRGRFIFKTFSQRVEEIDIDIYRSLDKVKSEPTDGSSFLRDCLIEWRELNTAEDFICCYEEIMPLAQTLPLVILHKELIISKLLSRLQVKARLSLEPILRLIASLSRDLLEDFIPFFPRLADSLASLLESGGEKEPEIIEQIFTSWSCVMMNLQRYLVRDLVHLLKVTVKLRYYPKNYIEEFMAEATSILLRNAPSEQLRKATKRLIFEVVKKPIPPRIYGASCLLCYAMKGTSSRFHSRAESILQLLVEDWIYRMGDQINQGSDTVIEVVKTVFQRLCEDIDTKQLSLLHTCLYEEITKALANRHDVHLNHLLSLLMSTLQDDSWLSIPGLQSSVFELIDLNLRTFFTNVKEDELLCKVVHNVLQLMLVIVKGLQSSKDTSAIYNCSLRWAHVFEIKSTRLLSFIRELLQMNTYVQHAFRKNILRTLNDSIETSPEEVVSLLLSFCESLQEVKNCESFDGASVELLRIQSFFQGTICHWIEEINRITQGELPSSEIDETKLAVLWGVIRSYPYMVTENGNSFVLMDLINALDQLVTVEAGDISGLPKHLWQSLIGAALSLYGQSLSSGKSGLEETGKFLHLAKRHTSCSQVLIAVADYLDFVYGSTLEADSNCRTYHQNLKAEKVVEALNIFSDSLSHPDKEIRISTLRILCHYEPLSCDSSTGNQFLEVSESCQVNSQATNIFQLLLSIELTPLSISTSRKVVLLISRLQMAVSTGTVCDAYVPLVLNGIIGIFHNRFTHLWPAASECLAVLVSQYAKHVWDKFVCYFEKNQSIFNQPDVEASELSVETDLVKSFHSFAYPTTDRTPSATILSLLLQSLQKIPNIVESHSRQIVPLFFKFLGYDSNHLASVGAFNVNACKGKEWKCVLKEWLNLLKQMRNLKSFYQSQFLEKVLKTRLLDENDEEIQMLVLDSMLTWKDDYLVPYAPHLKSLICCKTLREELTKWSLSKEYNQIEEHHRSNLVPIVIHLLMPKVRKLKALASRKKASVNSRKTVLGFIAQLDVDELPLFFALLMKPLRIISNESDDGANRIWTSELSLMDEVTLMNCLKFFTSDNITALSMKKRYGFLHVVEEILAVFDEFHLRPFLDILMGCVVRILGSCTSSLLISKVNSGSMDDCGANKCFLEKEKDKETADVLTSTSVKQFRDLRSLCLKIIYFALGKYENHNFGDEFWDLFFMSVKPLIDSFKQDGSSSEKPSSLFSCFVAMSKSYNLVPLLSREKNLIPDIFSILTVTSASEAIISFVLKFIENLLSLNSELDDRDNPIQSILLPNIDTLVSNLHALFQSNSANKRKLVKNPGETERRVFKFLSRYINNSLLARKFVDILLPFLEKRHSNSDFCMEVVQIFCDVAPFLGSEDSKKILRAVSPLLIFVERDVRLIICDLIDALAKADPSIQSLAPLVRDLNAMSAMEMDCQDFDTIVCTYEKICVDFFHGLPVNQALVVLSQCVHDMSSHELILRHSARRALLSFVEFSSVIFSQAAVDGGEITSSNWTRASIFHVTNKFLFKHMGEAMSREPSVKKEWINLLREMVLKLPELEHLNTLKALYSMDAEVDFFNNVTHLQRHRRARALHRFKNIINTVNISEVITSAVFVPLFFNMLFEEEGKAEHVRVACIEALASLSGSMEWKSYYALLRRCFRELTMNPNKQKVLLRLICSILGHFHFTESNYDAMSEIQKCLSSVVLPKLKKYMNYDSDKIDVNVNLATLKVLKLLPGDVMDSQLMGIIQHITNYLKHRLESVRDDARSALAACLKELGLEYLQILVKVMKSTLKRGFEMHVLGFTLNFILSKFLMNPIRGSLDYCLEDLLSVVEKDISGEVAEEKDVEKIASKMKETRKQKSYDTLKMIAENITFKAHALKLLDPVTNNLQKHLTPKAKMKLEMMLSSIAAGIESNPSVDQTDLFIFIYGLIEDGIKNENGQGNVSSLAGPLKKCRKVTSKNGGSLRRVVLADSPCSHLIMGFALKLLHGRIKKVKLGERGEQLLSMLDPFVSLLGKCLISKYEDVLSTTLRCLTPLFRLPLSSIKSQADKTKAVVLDIAQSSIDPNSPLMHSCLTLLIALLKSTAVTLSSDQLRLLIQFPLFIDLEKNPSFIALSLLKSIVSRKLVAPEIYDLATRVAELMVTSQVESIRKKCSKILLQFLLDYPLSDKRLQQHIDFLLSNLRYEHSTGRESVLEMLHIILIKFPKNVVDELSQTLFVHLVVCLANDHDNNVRSMTGIVIKSLIDRISPHLLNSILDYSVSWYLAAKKQHLRSAAAQVLGLLVEVLKKGFEKHVRMVLPVAVEVLQSAVNAITSSEWNSSDEANIPFWKEAYYSLVMLEKMLHHFHELCSEKDLEDLWELICKLLLHPHTWIRNISSRLIGSYFTIVTVGGGNPEKLFETHLLFRPNRLCLIAASLCCQLKTQLLDDAVGSVIAQNLFVALFSVHTFMVRMEKSDSLIYWSTLEQHEQTCFLKALQLLDSRKGRNMFLSLTSGICDQNDEVLDAEIRYFIVSNLLKQMGKIALQQDSIQMKIIFDTLSKFSSQVSQDDFQHYAYQILLPLYKVREGFAGKVIPDAINQLAQEVCESIQNSWGIQNFVQVYSQIKKVLKEKRDKRKQEEKRMAVINPMRNAKRKLRIASKNRANKKRRMTSMKMLRWARS